MTITSPKRVHVVPLGYEEDRVVEPAKQLKADRVVILTLRDNDDEIGQDCLETVEDQLEDADIETEVKECKIFDINESIRLLRQTIQDTNLKDDVKVNVSSGTKITAMAGMISCMFTDASAFYVRVNSYDENGIGRDVEEMYTVPSYPVSEPDFQLIQILDYIKENSEDGVILSDIGDFVLENNLPAVESSDKESGDGDEIYPLLRNQIVGPLLKRGLIREVPAAGAKYVKITQEGEDLLEFGQSLMSED